MSYDNDEHSFMFRFHSAEGERDLEMNCNALYLGDIFDRFRDFLQGCGYQIDGQIGVVPFDKEETYQAKQDNFSMEHLPNNGWPFGVSQSVQALSTADIAALTGQMPLSASPADMAASWSAELPSSTGSKIRVQF